MIKYLMEYVKGQSSTLAADGYFSSFISNGVSAELCFVVFSLLTILVIYAGVQNGVERVSKVMMPVLVVLSIIIAVYSITRPGALAGSKVFSGAESGAFFLDDGGVGHGTDVLFPVYRHGHSGDLWFLYEKRYLD